MIKTAWLIESENQMYIGTQGKVGTHYLQWIADPHTALRFARKEDAEAMILVCKRMGYIGFHNEAKGATEHAWYTE